MNRRTFEEMVSYFNQTVADMDIDRKYKMELLGMITAIGIACEKELSIEPERKTGKWIPCSERLPDMHDEVIVTARGEVSIAWLYVDGKWRSNDMPQPMFRDIIAWMPLPEPYKED